MELKDYIRKLNKLIYSHPELLDCNVIYSKDEEGNNFRKGYFDENDNDFQTEEDGSDVGIEINAICIN